jgi:hypothetical protein
MQMSQQAQPAMAGLADAEVVPAGIAVDDEGLAVSCAPPAARFRARLSKMLVRNLNEPDIQTDGVFSRQPERAGGSLLAGHFAWLHKSIEEPSCVVWLAKPERVV